jgi:putative spermidine/putrescine transport system permease protein
MWRNPITSVALWVEQNQTRVLLLPVAFLTLFYVVPLLGIALLSLMPGNGLSFEKYIELASDGTFLLIVWRTIWLSLLVSLLCLILGYPYAYVLNKAKPIGRRFLILAVLAPFFTSILIRSYAWVAILGARGPVNALLLRLGIIDSPLTLVYNEFGALVGMVQIQLPLMILTLYGAMRRIETDLTRAAESLGAHPITTLCKVFIPLSLPGIISGLCLIFTSTLGFYVTPELLGSPREYVVTQSIYVRMNSLNDFSGAAAQAVVLLVFITLLLFLLRRFLGTIGDAERPELTEGGRPSSRLPSRFPELIILKLGRWADALYLIARGFVALEVTLVVVVLTATMVAVIPLGFSRDPYLRLPPTGYSLRWIIAYLTNDDWLSSTFFSLWISISSACIATLIGAIAAYAMARWESRRKRSLELFFISPMIVPQFIVALALYFIFIKLHMIGSPATYLIAYAVFAFPYVFLVMYAAFQRFEFSLVQSGAILGATPIAIWRRIVLPILLPSFLSAGLFAFLTAFDDLIVALFFSTAGQYTLPMRMWADIRAEISPQIAAVAVVFLAVALIGTLVVGVVRKLIRRRRIRNRMKDKLIDLSIDMVDPEQSLAQQETTLSVTHGVTS